ncbi:MAG TPA: hypothetical protein VHT53_09000 [Candidatus Elarobacter sp.]|nr:hypothetical protein [Candidatus Elarobacter sp.]
MNVPLTIAYAIALGATVLLLRHVAVRYRAAPDRVPVHINPDGRPSARTAGKWLLWLPPGIVAVIVAILGVALGLSPPREDQAVLLTLAMLAIAEVAWFVAWTTDRQIEIARNMTIRIAPARLLRATLPLLVTVAVILALALRPS